MAFLGAAALLVPLTLGSPAHADAAPPLPSADPFYTTDAASLADYAHGAVIDTRSATAELTDLSEKPITGTDTQVLYRTRNALGGLSETVTTVIQPSDIGVTTPSKGIVAYLSFYDGLSDSCDPSYTLQQTPNEEAAVIGQLLEAGYTVTVPDFEGETLDWAAGHEAGWSTLDAIAATETQLNLPATTKVGMIGYSGGSIAGEWAAEIAPTYAPDLTIVGDAIGGVPVNLAHVMQYVDSSADKDRNQWVGVIPAAAVALARAYGDDFTDYLSDEGKTAAAAVADQCIADFAANYPGLHVSDFVKPGVDLLSEPDVKQIVDGLVMGQGHTPTTPMFMFQGRDDGIGDGVMVAADVKALATKYCAAGLPVTYTQLDGTAHAAAGTSFILQGIGYLQAQFAASNPMAASSSCAALLPHPAPPKAPKPVQRPIMPSIAGHSKGSGDVLVIASALAKGAFVQLYRTGSTTVIGHARIGAGGRATITVHDRNGRTVTHYRAHLDGTTTTKAAYTRTIGVS